MPAQLVTCGEFAVGVGGEFEQECARQLRDNLPEQYVIATNVNVLRGGREEENSTNAMRSYPRQEYVMFLK